MGYLTFPVVAIFLAAALFTRSASHTLSENSILQVNLWELMINDNPRGALPIFTSNIILFWSFYTIAYLSMYVFGAPIVNIFKFNPKYPKNKLILKEIYRSFRGVLICSFEEWIINILYEKNYLPIYCNSFLCTSSNDIGLFSILFMFLLIYLWGDAHFYWTHRMLHNDWFYKCVHKEHHESFNPDPWSGLSMHWFESSVYFSAATLFALVSPLWVVGIMYKSLIVFPIEGHCGHGTWDVEGSYNHYIHHSKFKYNYGSSPLWDHIMGTNYIDDNNAKSAKEAKKQAELVAGEITPGKKGVAVCKAE